MADDPIAKVESAEAWGEFCDLLKQAGDVVLTAEDIRIRQYGDTAVVAFRLLGSPEDGSGKVMEYLNTGTFLKRDAEWRVVAWQATIIPEPE